jgi:hypothetical protein
MTVFLLELSNRRGIYNRHPIDKQALIFSSDPNSDPKSDPNDLAASPAAVYKTIG